MQLYRISFPPELTRKAYVGITSKTAAARFKGHCRSAKTYPIVQALKAYGAENAILEVLGDYADWPSLYEAEQQAIARFGTKAPDGYNLTDGGSGAFGLPASDARKAKISAANAGRRLTDAQREAISTSNRSRDLSANVEAMARANRGRKLSTSRAAALRDVWVGRSHTADAKARMAASAKGRRHSPETRAKMSASLKGRKMSAESLAKRAETVRRKKELCGLR